MGLKSSKYAKISDTVTNLMPMVEEEPSCCKCEDQITNLPTEILEIILENLTYDEISKVREVSRRFRDVGNEILNRGFLRILPNCVHHIMYSLLQVNELPDKALELYGLEKYVKRDAPTERKTTTSEQIIILRCLWLLNLFIMQINLLNAICLRFLLLKDISPSICYSRSFFAGKIMDEILRILRLIRLKRVEKEDVNVDVFLNLVDTFIDFFHDRIEPTLVVNEAVMDRNKIFGSKVVDLLDCCFDCRKNVKFSVDSEDWCHFKGEYKFDKSFFTCLSSINDQFDDVESLSVKKQSELHQCLCRFINRRNKCILLENHVLSENFVLMGTRKIKLFTGSYEGLADCDNSLYFYGYFSYLDYLSRFHEDDEGDEANELGNGEKLDLTFNVEMKCRKKLAPLRVFSSSSSTGDEQCKLEGLTEDKEDDLVLRLDIICPTAAKENNRLSPVYRCLIKQKYLQEESLSNPDGIEEGVIIPVDNNSDIVIIRDNLKVKTKRISL